MVKNKTLPVQKLSGAVQITIVMMKDNNEKGGVSC
jgi:hypothetical protein